MALPQRLTELLDRCEPGIPLWDLCCDHGLLGLAALTSNRFSEVVFNDIVSHVLDPLRERLKEVNHARVICAPAEAIAEQLRGNIVIAGVGGEKIYRILTHHLRRQSHRLDARKILLCPEKDVDWLLQQPLPELQLLEKHVIAHNHTTRVILAYRQII